MKLEELIGLYGQQDSSKQLTEKLKHNHARIQLKGLAGSSASLVVTSTFHCSPSIYLIILSDKESAAYFYNDLENLFNEQSLNYDQKKILFFPASYKRTYVPDHADNVNTLLRTEVLNRLNNESRNTIIVTYPEALAEKVITKKHLSQNTLKLKTGENITIDFINTLLTEYDFERTDFVIEPGQFSIRGGIVDIFSFANDYPYRIEFSGDSVESIRTFDPVTQLSIDKLSRLTIVSNTNDFIPKDNKESFLSYIHNDSSVIWIDDIAFATDKINTEYEKAKTTYNHSDNESLTNHPFIQGADFLKEIITFSVIEFGKHFYFDNGYVIHYNISPQPSFNKNFDLLLQSLHDNSKQNIANIIIADSPKQIERIYSIIEDIRHDKGQTNDTLFATLKLTLHEGFIDKDCKIACYTDHQIFQRYHRFRLRDSLKGKESFSLKELYNLTPGDYVTHIDHGIGKFDGLEKIDVKGKEQEAIRLLYRDGDILYISIHSLHRISKYVGKEGTEPALHRLGSDTWNRLKEKTKKKVKDIAKDLIKLYAERRASKGFSFSPDSYLQHEIEASFIYEDTPDQIKSTVEVKKDMEADYPMDRLICGDVGFGKTEIAIRAAFKAVADNKQVAVLVPTTILALQHYNTFRERLQGFPCSVNYINRFKSTKAQKQTLKALEEGKLDIIIGTHRLVSKDVKFKNLGLLIIDEEQKFGVATKEKLKQIKVNVDTLTLTATPIPRTLQFSLMGARDLSIINTAPPNRQPIHTELHVFNEEVIREAILYEVSRGGQVFFVHNRIQNITEVAGTIQRLCPDVKTAIGHGQMEGKKLEEVMLDFIEGEYDVLVATTIIESGLDISNVNTIIINDAHNYGLSDLHQLRGRVGRTNKKAFCYLISPPLTVLTDDARKRLKAIEEFTDLGSGFNIAMRDLDIRGAGNILGAEQSGFISEVGFDTYHKILNEAIQELKETDFKDVYKDTAPKEYIKDCQLETDLEILFPDEYISNIAERLNLYKELDSIETEDKLMTFQEKLIDRFGPIPVQTQELINAIRLRWLAAKTGFEKIILKENMLRGYFISNQESAYYQSDTFNEVLNFIKKHPQICRMKEKNDKLSITFNNINSINQAFNVLLAITPKDYHEK